MDEVDKSKLNEVDLNHWKGVAYFFRAYNYFDLLRYYGDIKWLEHTAQDTDMEALYGNRTPRIEVAENILRDLKFAVEHIKAEGSGRNTITPDVARALISRFGLFEGTWRKYHKLSGGDVFLKASYDASAALVEKYPTLHENYDDLFNSNDLAGVKGVLLYKQYIPTQLTHTAATFARSSSGRHDLTRKAVDMFLMTDGQTRWTSPLFKGDKNPYDEFRNRDLRLYYCTPPPYRVNVGSPASQFTFTANPKDREYIDIMNSFNGPNGKRFPLQNWGGLYAKTMPHYQDYQEGQPFNISFNGYYFYKYYNGLTTGISSQDISDCPIFRMGEVFVNHAEAAYELGVFNQVIADKTINKLRSRGKVASLDIAAISNDPTRDTDIDAILWEIRRERAIELLGEGFRFDDLRRWHKLDYLTVRKKGRYVTKGNINEGADFPANSTIPLEGGGTAGYIAYRSQPSASIAEHYYLYPIPHEEVVLNKVKGFNIQNPGWE